MSDATSQPLTDAEADRAQLLALLQAMATALDVPPPATVGDQAAYLQLLEERADSVRLSLASVLADRSSAAFDTAYLTRVTDRSPVTYTSYESAAATTDEPAEAIEAAEESATVPQDASPAVPVQGRVVAEPATVAACQADYASTSGTAARDAMARQAAARARHS